MMENGQLVAKKFGIDWPDCVLQCEQERSSVSLKHYVRYRLCQTDA